MSKEINTGTRLEQLAGEQPVNPFSKDRSGYGHKVNGAFISVYPPGSEMHNFHT